MIRAQQELFQVKPVMLSPLALPNALHAHPWHAARTTSEAGRVRAGPGALANDSMVANDY